MMDSSAYRRTVSDECYYYYHQQQRRPPDKVVLRSHSWSTERTPPKHPAKFANRSSLRKSGSMEGNTSVLSPPDTPLPDYEDSGYDTSVKSERKFDAVISNRCLELSPPDTPLPDYEASNHEIPVFDKFDECPDEAITDQCLAETYLGGGIDVPDPDYLNEDEEDIHNGDKDYTENNGHVIIKPSDTRERTHSGSEPEEPLIRPKKLYNPCLESKERLELHKELLLNHKLGLKPNDKKSELNKMFEKRKHEQKVKEWEETQLDKRTSLEMKLEKRANKLKEEEEHMKAVIEDDTKQPEFVRLHRRITHKQKDVASESAAT